MLRKFNLSEEKGSRSVRQLLVEQLPSVGLNVFGTNMSIRFHVIWFVTLVICLFELTALNVILKVSGKRYFRDSLDTCIQLTPVTYSPERLSQKFLVHTHSSLDPATMQKRTPSWVLSCLFYEVFQNSISPVQTTTACAEDRNVIFLPMDFLLNRSINKNVVQLELSTGSLTLPQSCLCSCFWNQPSVWI